LFLAEDRAEDGSRFDVTATSQCTSTNEKAQKICPKKKLKKVENLCLLKEDHNASEEAE
jgi:hypothetical protein